MSEILGEYKYIVVGLGGIGSGTLYWLSKRVGSDVLGLEQFSLGHNNGGSQDISRIIRLTYHDPKYTKLCPDAYAAWEAVEQDSGIQLVYKTGSLDLGIKGELSGDLCLECKDAMDKINAKSELLNGEQIRKRFPEITVPDNFIGVYEPTGGLVDAANGNSVHVQLARGNGAKVVENCGVISIERQDNGKTKVVTTVGVFLCSKIIITSGAWINNVLSSVGVNLPVTVTQEQVTYYATQSPKQFTASKFPIILAHMLYEKVHDYYLLPIYSNSYFKIGIDATGRRVTAENRSFVPDEHRERKCTEFLQKYIPRACGPIAYSKTCLYAMTPDRHFIIDDLKSRDWPNIILCCGAGHAYKFASLLGKILSEMAIDGRTHYDISAFSMNREAIMNKNYKPHFYLAMNTKANL